MLVSIPQRIGRRLLARDRGAHIKRRTRRPARRWDFVRESNVLENAILYDRMIGGNRDAHPQIGKRAALDADVVVVIAIHVYPDEIVRTGVGKRCRRETMSAIIRHRIPIS